MAIVDDRYVVAQTLSEGWLEAVRCLYDAPKQKAVHLLVRIINPATEFQEIRKEAQGLIDDWNSRRSRESAHFYEIDTVRNTIFPAAWAKRHPEPNDLAAYYQERYSRLRALPANARGTYFGRIVAYPRGEDDPGDQLTETVRKLRQELAGSGPKSSRYEINIHHEASDRNTRGFPCLAHLAMHLHQKGLHLQAIYRNETLVSRGYGNYLGLAQLQRYVAEAVEVDMGELLITAGHAQVDGRKGAVKAMLERFPPEPVDGSEAT